MQSRKNVELKAVQNHTAEAKVKNKLQFEGGDPLAPFQEDKNLVMRRTRMVTAAEDSRVK